MSHKNKVPFPESKLYDGRKFGVWDAIFDGADWFHWTGITPALGGELPEICLEAKGKTSRAIQTSGFCEPEIFNQILSECDYVLYDIKLIDDEQHTKYTGVSNQNILKNFKKLAKSSKQFVVRIPLIPDVTDTENNLSGIADLLAEN